MKLEAIINGNIELLSNDILLLINIAFLFPTYKRENRIKQKRIEKNWKKNNWYTQ